MVKRKTSILAAIVLASSVYGSIALAPSVKAWAPPEVPYTAVESQVYKEPIGITSKYFKTPYEKYTTPGLAEGKAGFSTHEEMMKFVQDTVNESKYAYLETIGYTREGRPIPMVILGKDGGKKAKDITKLNKPIVWIQAQIHGNEPASGEATLVTLQKLATGELTYLLDKISVVIVPRFNGDGSYYFNRTTATDIDSNRDHIKFDNPETIAVHKAFNRFNAQVVIDAHEYGVNSSFKDIGEKGALTYHDILILSAKNLNIPEKVRTVSDDLFVKEAQDSLTLKGISNYWYYTTSGTGENKTLNMGDWQGKIGRNAYGLQPAFSFLVETRGIGIGKQNFHRRVFSHVETQENILKTAAKNTDLIMKTIEDARAEIVTKGATVGDNDKIVVQTKYPESTKGKFEVIDLATENKVEIPVNVNYGQEAKLTRERPTAYILPPAYHELATKLSYSGIEVQKLDKEMSIPVEVFKVTDNKVNTVLYEGHLRNNVTVDVSKRTIKFPKGSYVFYMAQPNASILPVSLEPDSEDSFVTFNYIPVEKDDEVPVYRYMDGTKLSTSVVK